MSSVTALMYHVIYDGPEEWALLKEEERPYAISVSEFTQQLDEMENANISILDPAKFLKKKSLNNINKGVILTFDDGHNSFYNHAYKILKKRGYRAIFFITTDLIEQREDFCSWDNLSTMAKEGFLIQAHGKTHHFLPDLDDASLKLEYQIPKEILEQHTGQKVFSMSFPGGRYNQREIAVGMKLGYEFFFTSSVGIITDYSLKKNITINRVPIRFGMKINTFLKLAQGRRISIWPRKITYQLKLLLKLFLGNRVYHVIYKKIFK